MNILRSWKESLSLFRPAHFKLFLLVTLNAIIKAGMLILKIVWPLLAILFIFLCMNFLILSSILFILIILSFILAARPSVAKKDIHYFLSYGRYVFMFVVLAVGIEFIPYLFLFMGAIAIITFFGLFFIDGPAQLPDAGRAFFRAVKMTWYNLPFILISAATFTALVMAIRVICQLVWPLNAIPGCIMMVIDVCLLLVPVCFYVNFYVKKIHDNFEFYFGKQ